MRADWQRHKCAAAMRVYGVTFCCRSIQSGFAFLRIRTFQKRKSGDNAVTIEIVTHIEGCARNRGDV